MQIIENIKKELTHAGINEAFLNLYSQATDFKIKLFAPFVFGSVISWILYCIFVMGLVPDSFMAGLSVFFLGGIVQPLAITLLFSYLIPINSGFFKLVSHVFPGNKGLSSLIDSTDYQDTILSKLFENKEFMASLINFYSLLDSINFSTNYGNGNDNHSHNPNEDINKHFVKLQDIIDIDDKAAFISFFKSKFSIDWTTYSEHDKVLALSELTVNQINNGLNKDISVNPQSKKDDLIHFLVEEVKLKKKFKNIL